MPRCGHPNCIAPASQTVTDGDDEYVFCAGHFATFENHLNELRVERDRLVSDGVEFEMANRIIQQRVERQEL